MVTENKLKWQKMNKYILIGIPNSGKSTLGRRYNALTDLTLENDGT